MTDIALTFVTLSIDSSIHPESTVDGMLFKLCRLIRSIQPNRLSPLILVSLPRPNKYVLPKIVFPILNQMTEFIGIKIEIGHIIVNIGAEYFIDGKAEIIEQQVKLVFVVLTIAPPIRPKSTVWIVHVRANNHSGNIFNSVYIRRCENKCSILPKNPLDLPKHATRFVQ